VLFRSDQTPDISPSPAPVAEAVVAAAPAVDQAGPDEAKQEKVSEPAPVPRAPTLKLRDFALKNFMARPASLNEAPAQETLVQRSAEPESASAPLAAGDSPGAAETWAETAAPAVASAGASVVMLSPRPSPASDIRLKIAPLTFRPPVFAAPPSPPVAFSPVPEPVAEKAPTPEPPAPEQPVPPEAALLSSASGAKIGASFEALAESRLARDKDLVERAAREMLRPMLKSWLDDHLPSLVERLLRAEIERVARGRD
jgi:cell pole-organizing protein PopZ